MVNSLKMEEHPRRTARDEVIAMLSKQSLFALAAAIGGIVLGIAVFAAAPAARAYAPLALLLPLGALVSVWRHSSDESRLRNICDAYAFREIIRMKRKRVEGW
jgi:hypothetical protein